MAARGEILYWLATVAAALVFVLAAVNTLYTASIINHPIIPVAALLLAGLIWLVGWFCRFVFV